jgi:hypothetical protein
VINASLCRKTKISAISGAGNGKTPACGAGVRNVRAPAILAGRASVDREKKKIKVGMNRKKC